MAEEPQSTTSSAKDREDPKTAVKSVPFVQEKAESQDTVVSSKPTDDIPVDVPKKAPAKSYPSEDRYVVLHTVLGRRMRPLTKEEIDMLPDLPGQMKPTAIAREPFVRGDVVDRDELTAPSDGYDNIARLESIGAVVGLTDAESAAKRQVAVEASRWGLTVDRESAIIVKRVELEGDRSMAIASRRQAIDKERRELESR